MSSVTSGDARAHRLDVLFAALNDLTAAASDHDAARIAAQAMSTLLDGAAAAVLGRKRDRIWTRLYGVGTERLPEELETPETVRPWPYRPGEVEVVPQLADYVAAAPHTRGFYDAGVRALVGAPFGRVARASGYVAAYLMQPLAAPIAYDLERIIGILGIATGNALDRIHASFPFTALADDLPLIVFRANALGTTEYFSAGWFAYTGLDHARTYHTAQRTDAAVHPDDVTTGRDAWAAAVASQAPHVGMHFRLRGRDGVYRSFELRANAILEGLTLVGWLGTLRPAAARAAWWDVA